MLTRSEIISRLDEITTQLHDAYIEEADLSAAEHETKIRAWMADDSQYVTTRDRTADAAAMQPSLDRIRLSGDIRALQEQRDNYRIQLQYGKF